MGRKTADEVIHGEGELQPWTKKKEGNFSRGKKEGRVRGMEGVLMGLAPSFERSENREQKEGKKNGPKESLEYLPSGERIADGRRDHRNGEKKDDKKKKKPS